MDKQKIVDALKAGKVGLVSRYNRALLRAGKRLDLSGADLTRANLKWVNLEGANLEEADLQRATLIAASLKRANLAVIDLDAADLRKANLAGANLEGANLEAADLQWGTLIGANLDYSSGLPRWCGSFNVQVDDEFAHDEAYHFCRLIFPAGSDGEKIQQYLKRYANRSGLIERHGLQRIT